MERERGDRDEESGRWGKRTVKENRGIESCQDMEREIMGKEVCENNKIKGEENNSLKEWKDDESWPFR